MKKRLEHEPDATDEVEFEEVYEGDIVKIHNESGIDHMTDSQKKRVSRFYEVLANAMPLDGRDYEVRFEPFPDGMSVRTSILGKTELGVAFARAVARQWAVEGGKDYDIRKE